MKILQEGVWKPIRFTVYNHLEEEEVYPQYLEKIGYDSGIDDLVCKTIPVDNDVAIEFKHYIEHKLQHGRRIVAVCVIDDTNFLTVVKPRNVDAWSILEKSQS